jgi:hypothetical protein
MEQNQDTENKVNFIMETDWLFQEPIDFEHKKYILLAYLKKIDEIINQNKIYPAFIELSLHLASIQTLIKENVILYTDKKFRYFDDEVLLKELLAKSVPTLSNEDNKEIDKIIKFSASKFFEYFSILKSYWSIVYESISISVKRNKKSINKPNGYMTYYHKSDDKVYVWEYILNQKTGITDENISNIVLIYEGGKKQLTLNQIIDNFSNFTEKDKKNVPVFDLKSTEDYPLMETLLPLFKRKLLSFIFQSIKFEDVKNI